MKRLWITVIPTGLFLSGCADGATFARSEGVTYFGQVDIEWINNGGFKASDMFGLVGAAISESKMIAQLMTVSQGNMVEVVKAYEQPTKPESIKPIKNVMKVGR